MEYTDLSIIENSAYKLADLINSGHYNNIFYYEFHEEVNQSEIYNCIEGLEGFSERVSKFYEIFMSYGYVDELPAVIHIALKVGDEWFIARDGGSNYYAGYGPMGIHKLREACYNKKITAFASNDNFEDWIVKKFGKPRKALPNERKSIDAIQFGKLLKALQYLTVDMQRRPEQFQDLTEENIRDKMLTPLNVVFKGRGHAESKNRKGKTDISVRTKDGLNEHIFELKVWGGVQTLSDTINQIGGYLAWHNNYCGIIFFCYNDDFTSILNKSEEFLIENYNYDKREKVHDNQFRIRMTLQTDSKKSIETHLVFINLKN